MWCYTYVISKLRSVPRRTKKSIRCPTCLCILKFTPKFPIPTLQPRTVCYKNRPLLHDVTTGHTRTNPNRALRQLQSFDNAAKIENFQNYSYSPSPYCAVNTLRLWHKNQSVNIVIEIIAVCSEIHTKHINAAVWAERKISENETGCTCSDHWSLEG